MARAAIVGVGAIGGVLAGLLETVGGHEITLCTRRPLPGLLCRNGLIGWRSGHIARVSQVVGRLIGIGTRQ